MEQDMLRDIDNQLLNLERRARDMEASIARVRAAADAMASAPDGQGINPRDGDLVRNLSKAASVEEFRDRITFETVMRMKHGTEPTRFERLLGMAVDGARAGGGPFIVDRYRWEARQPVVVHREDCPLMEGGVRRGLVAHVTRDDLARSGNGCRPCGTCGPDVPTRGGGTA